MLENIVKGATVIGLTAATVTAFVAIAHDEFGFKDGKSVLRYVRDFAYKVDLKDVIKGNDWENKYGLEQYRTDKWLQIKKADQDPTPKFYPLSEIHV